MGCQLGSKFITGRAFPPKNPFASHVSCTPSTKKVGKKIKKIL
jgi:hypothetical protein